ncbi:MAG: AEC family transporter [Devosia sp.]|jgi:predicted permease|nr:AEC family transporter [Devosiaceae bacterium]
MLAIFNVVAPIFTLIAVGFLAVRLKLYPQRGVDGLVSFVNNFATPCLLFESMLTSDFRRVFNLAIIGPFYAGAIFSLIAGSLIARKIFRNGGEDSIASGFSAMFTNTLLVGFPVIQRAYGTQAMPTVFSIIALHGSILLTLGMLTMEFVRHDGGSLAKTLLVALRRIASNPLIWGIAAGVTGNFAGITPPEPVTAVVTMMGQAVVPAALFGIGGALNEYRFSESWMQAAAMAVLKLVVHPLIAWTLMVPVLHVDPLFARYGVLLAAMPSGINAYVFATYYNRGTSVAANTLLIGTVAAAVTVSAWLAFLG